MLPYIHRIKRLKNNKLQFNVTNNDNINYSEVIDETEDAFNDLKTRLGLKINLTLADLDLVVGLDVNGELK